MSPGRRTQQHAPTAAMPEANTTHSPPSSVADGRFQRPPGRIAWPGRRNRAGAASSGRPRWNVADSTGPGYSGAPSASGAAPPWTHRVPSRLCAETSALALVPRTVSVARGEARGRSAPCPSPRARALVADPARRLGDRHLDAVRAPPARRSTCTTSPPRRPGRGWPPRACSRLSPRPSRSPNVRLRDSGDEQVATRSPSPASPANVIGSAPSAPPSRAVSPSPRVISDARVLSPKPMPDGHAAGQRDDVLDRAADLAADDVGVGVRAEVPGAGGALHGDGAVVVGAGDHRGGRLLGRDLPGEVGAGDDGDLVLGRPPPPRRYLAHPLERAQLDALDQADQRCFPRAGASRQPAGWRAASATAPRTRRRRRRRAPRRRPCRRERRG